MKAFILAAGRGQRLKPLTDRIPKPLVEVQGNPLLLHHLLALQAAGIKDVVINVAWLGEQIKAFVEQHTPAGLHVQVSDEHNTALETGGGMLKALPLLGDKPFLSINADVFTDVDYGSLARHSMAADLIHLVLVNNPPHNAKGDFSQHQGRLLLAEKCHPTYTYSGIGIFSPRLFRQHSHRLNEPFSVVPMIKQAIQSQQAEARVHNGYWTDVGTPTRLAELNLR